MTSHGHLVGVLGTPHTARVDAHGRVEVDRATWGLDWWIGGDDRWHFPDREVAVRQTLVHDMPVVETAMRVPGGDVVHRVYGVATNDALLVVEVENASPAPFVVALVVRGASLVGLDGSVVEVDGHRAIATPRPPSRWSVSTDASTAAIVARGDASEGPFVPRRDRAARLETALLHPLPHRASLRAVVALGRRDLGDVEPSSVPSAADVARGWQRQLGAGMRVVVPDEGLQRAIARSRAATRLAGEVWSPDGRTVAALEDWGFDAEAKAAWRRLGFTERRRASRRATTRSWDALRALEHEPAAFLLALRSLLVAEDQPGEVALMPAWPPAWRGLGVEVHDVPLREGTGAFAVRWHGDRPALLWDVPAGLRVRAPGLDPSWVSTESTGEALLGAAG